MLRYGDAQMLGVVDGFIESRATCSSYSV